MQPQRAVIVNGVRLVREMIKQVIERSSEIEVIKEIGEMQELASAIIETNATWAFVILLPDHEIPENMKFELFLKYPTLRLVGLWVDGSHVRLEWHGRGPRELTSPTLDELTRLLKEEIQKGLSGSNTNNRLEDN